MATEKFKYFAFISYNSKDTKWGGGKLQRKLEGYRMAAALCSEHGWERNPIKPVYLAPTDIQPMELTADRQERLKASRNLIVICSPNSSKSQLVGKEIEFFHSLGRTNDISFFIVDGVPHSGNEDTDCFNPIIETLGLPEISSANIHEKVSRWPWINRERAYAQLVTKLLGVEFDSIWKRHKRLLIEKVVVRITGIIFILAALLGIWLNNQPVDVHIRLNEVTIQNSNLPPLENVIVTLTLDNEIKTSIIPTLEYSAFFTNIPHKALGKNTHINITCQNRITTDTIVKLSENMSINIARDPKLEQSEKGAAKACEDISQDLFRLYQESLNIDYLRKRVDLNPIDLNALSDLANICYLIGKYIVTMDGSGLDPKFYDVSSSQEWFNCETGIPDYHQAHWYLNEALVTFNRIYELEPTINHIGDIAKTKYLLGDLYFAIVDYEQSEKFYLSSKENFIQLYKINPEAYQVNINDVEKKIEKVRAEIKNNLENTNRYLSFIDDFKYQVMQNPFDFRADLISERYINIAKSHGIVDERDFINVNKLWETNKKRAYEEYEQNPDISHQAVLALECLIDGSFYYQDYCDFIWAFKRILEQYRSLCEQDPDLFRPFFIVTLYNFGFIYLDNDVPEKGIPYFEEAVKNLEIIYKQDSSKYQEPLAITLENLNLAIIYSLDRSDKKKELEKLLSSTLSKYQVLVERNPEAYAPKLAYIQKELARLSDK